MKFFLVGLYFTFASAITHHSGYNSYPPNANTGYAPNNGPCCQELALLKQQIVQQQQQLLQLQQQQQQGRIVHNKQHESSASTLNSVLDSSVAPVPSKGYSHQLHGPVVGNAEYSGTKVFNYHSQGPLVSTPGQIHYINHQHHHHQGGSGSNSGQLSSLGSIGSSSLHTISSSKGSNYQGQPNGGSNNGQIVQGHLLVGNHVGPVNGPSAAQQIANKYSAHANSGYNTASTTVLRPPVPQGGFTVSQLPAGYNVNANYNGAASQQYATTTKLTSQGSGGSSYSSASGSGSGLSITDSLSNYAGSASDKTYTQTHLVNSNGFALGGSSNGKVEKHIYVHVPPEDFSSEAEESAKLQHLIQPKKHYKIIFIKAPTVSSGPNYQQLLSQGGLTQEKTLVYVLVKKPDEPSAEEIAAIQNQAVKHNKPEVFFIKYKTRKEAEQAAQTLGHSQFIGNFVGSDLGVDIRNAGAIHSHESLESVANAIESAETYSKSSSGSSSSISSSVNDVSSSYLPPTSSLPKPAPVYGVPSVKK